MIEPTLALQKAIRATLLASIAVTALVPNADNIRAGGSRPGEMPTIIMSDGHTEMHGQDYTSQRGAWVHMDLHCWTLDGGEEGAKHIAFAVMTALDKTLMIDGGYCDHFRVTNSVYPRDPDPRFGHGVVSVEALIRWIV